MLLVCVNVHGGPGQREHAGAQAVLQVRERGLHQRGGHRDDGVHDAGVLIEAVGEVIKVALELGLLQHYHLCRLRDD